MYMGDNVIVNYDKYGSESVIEDATLELFTDTTMKLECDERGKKVTMSIFDVGSPDAIVSGELTYDKLMTLIRILSQFKGQIKK